MRKKEFHCCATCIHFKIKKEANGNKTVRYCGRLGFETKPTYQFNCWEPKELVLNLMKKVKD